MGFNRVECTVDTQEIIRVKGLGCLRDKTTSDCFNCRVITRNGKITAKESMIIANASEKFGSGEIAFTTRQTVEIQKVPFENIAPMIEYLNANGLETGGTGAKVRPIVSCKGTTCIYGLIDTYGLSLKIHERFYKGYHDVNLPHKFKIAVGGCPNNCVKPNLNDLGVIGSVLVNEGDTKIFGYKVVIGGRWGKKTAVAKPLSKILATEEEVLDVIERAIILFRDEGVKNERFSDTIERLGFDYVEKKLLNI